MALIMNSSEYRKFLPFFLLTILAVSFLANTDTSDTQIKHAKGEQPVILIVGDSLSAAYNLAEEDGWGYLLQKRLKKGGYPYDIVNASVGGATTAAGLQRLPSLLAQVKPSIVIIQLGTNDGLQGKPVSYITANLERLITQSQDAGATVLLVGLHLPPNFGERYTKPFHAQYASLSEKYKLNLVPFLLQGVARNPALMQRDGLHPTAEAQPAILENVWPHLKPMLVQVSVTSE